MQELKAPGSGTQIKTEAFEDRPYCRETGRAQDSKCEYVCRTIVKAQVPCQDREQIQKHFVALNALEHPHLCKFVEAASVCVYYTILYCTITY